MIPCLLNMFLPGNKDLLQAYFSFAFELRAGEKRHLKNFKKTREDIGIY